MKPLTTGTGATRGCEKNEIKRGGPETGHRSAGWHCKTAFNKRDKGSIRKFMAFCEAIDPFQRATGCQEQGGG